MALAGKVALVTGGGRRVGAAICRDLARAGVHVAIHYHHARQEAQDLARELEGLGVSALACGADLTQPPEVRTLFASLDEHFGGLDLLVNNAAVFVRQPIETFDFATQNQLLQVNLLAPLLCTQLALPLMRARGGGAVVNLVDVGGELAWAQYAGYCASKAGLIAATRALALELAPLIRVNAVAPGLVLWRGDEPEALRARLEARIPLGQRGSPEGVARAVRYLLEEPEITGIVLRVDGGRSLLG